MDREMGTDVTRSTIEHATVTRTSGSGVSIHMELSNGGSLSGKLPKTATDEEIHTLVEALEQAAEALA